MKMVWTRPKPNLQENANQFTDFSVHENGFGCIQNQSLNRYEQTSRYIAHENGFGCIQNQSLDRWEQISQFIAHENGFGCIQNQSSGQMQTN
jgi:flagellar hook-length control protein FliK